MYLLLKNSQNMSNLSAFTKNCLKFIQIPQSNLLRVSSITIINEHVRHHKHFIPKWKKMRAQKFIKIEIPNLNEKESDLTEEQIRSRMKERGLSPPRPWMERPFSLSSTSEIFEAYVPPEGDGKMSMISKEGAKQKLQLLEKKSKSMLAIRKIKSFDDDFDGNVFIEIAQSIYIKAHQYLSEKNKYKLREYVTERAYPELIHNTRDKTIRWSFVKSLQPARIVHARCTNLIEKDNMFGQVTIRFHTQQTLAIFDRFGRLMHGNEFIPKDVLEYIVFEKHLANEYGTWKLHGKIIPDWMPPRMPSARTYVVSDEPFTVEADTALLESTAINESVAEAKQE